MNVIENESDAQSMAKIIFKDEELKSEWLESPFFASYLIDITGFKIDKCVKEADRLEDEILSVYEQTRDLAFKNYPSFIQTANCFRDIFSDFETVEKCLESVQSSLPTLETKCQEFSDKANDINSHRKFNSLTLDKHPQLLEVLELPQLMETCVKNNYYEEALDLISHVKRMGNKHGNLTLITNLVKEVQESTHLMLHQLLGQLRNNIQLPQCLKVIGYLRRLNIFSESQLRVKFLQARNTWLEQILSSIPKEDAYFHITKTIELSRIHLFDIITQYRAIFSDDDSVNHSIAAKEKLINDRIIFTSWVLHKVQEFLETLEVDLERDLSGRLDTLLGQCMYFGLSFSRVGADFRMLLVPLFIKTSLKTFESGILSANHAFEDEMLVFTVESCLQQHFVGSSDYYNQETLQPPFSLMEFVPLAGYCNNVLTAFNNLRLCCPLAIVDEVTSILTNSLIHVVNIISSFHRQQQESFTSREVESFKKLCFVLCQDMLPFLNRCLQTLFPITQLSSLTGIPMTSLQKQSVGSLNIANIIDPIREIAPSEIGNKESEMLYEEEDNPDVGSDDQGIFFTAPSNRALLDDAIVGHLETPSCRAPFDDSIIEHSETLSNRALLDDAIVGNLETPSNRAPLVDAIVEDSETPSDRAPIDDAIVEHWETPSNRAPLDDAIVEHFETPSNRPPVDDAIVEHLETPSNRAPLVDAIVEDSEMPNNRALLDDAIVGHSEMPNNRALLDDSIVEHLETPSNRAPLVDAIVEHPDPPTNSHLPLPPINNTFQEEYIQQKDK